MIMVGSGYVTIRGSVLESKVWESGSPEAAQHAGRINLLFGRLIELCWRALSWRGGYHEGGEIKKIETTLGFICRVAGDGLF